MSKEIVLLKIQEEYLDELSSHISRSLVGKVLKRFEIIENKEILKAIVREQIYEEFRQFKDLLVAHDKGINISIIEFKSSQHKEGDGSTHKE